MLEMNLTLRDVGWSVFFITAFIAGIFAIRAFIHIGEVFKAVKKMIDKNAGNINKFTESLPVLSESALDLMDTGAEIADGLRNEQELIDAVLEDVGETIESVSDTARMVNEDFFGGVKRLARLMSILISFITRKKTPGEAPGPGAEAASPADYSGVSGDGASGRRPARARRKRAPQTTRKRHADRGKNVNIHIK